MQDTVNFIGKLKEKESYPLLRDLLTTMGYRQVTITHGPLEDGRDLVFMEEDRLHRQVWRGVQVKVGLSTGSLSLPSGLRSIVGQCEAALEKPYLTAAGERVVLRELWLIFTTPLTEAAKRSAQEAIARQQRIYLVDAAHLADLLKEYLPDLLDHVSPLESYLSNLTRVCDSLDEYIYSRLSARFTLKSVFVQPEAELSLVTAEALSEAPPLLENLGLRNLNNLEDKIILGLSRLLPAYEAITIIGILTQVNSLVQSINSMKSFIPESPPEEDLISIANAFGYRMLKNGWGRFEPEEENLKPLDKGLLQAIEAEIMENLSSHRGVARSIVEPLYVWERFNQAEASKRNSEDEGRLRKRRDNCLESLGKAYRSSADLADPMTQVATLASQIMSKRQRLNSNLLAQVQGVEDSFAHLISFFDKFDLRLRETYSELWKSSRVAGLRPRKLQALNEELPENLEAVASLSSFLQAHYSISRERLVRVPVSARVMLNRLPRVLVRGELGIGKTTLLKHHALELAEAHERAGSGRLPVFCSLSAVGVNSVSAPLNGMLAEAATASFKSLGNVAAENVTWLLDGYDEMESEFLRSQLLEWCCARSSDSGRVVISSRPNVLPSYFPGLVPIRLLSLSAERLDSLIGKYFGDRLREGQRFRAIIKESEDLRGLARNPLMATLLVILAREIGVDQVPRRREQVYSHIVRLLLGEWDIAKGVRRSHEIGAIDARILLLRKLAFKFHRLGKRAFSQRDFLGQLLQLKVEPCVNVESAARLFHEFLRDCLIAPLGRDSFGFFHFSIQEYMAASDMAEEIYPNKVTHALKEYLGTQGEWWEEPLVFYAGIKRNVAYLVNEMKNYITGRNERQRRLVERLIRRWFEVADFTRLDDLNPKGLVAEVMAELNILEAGSQWKASSTLPG